MSRIRVKELLACAIAPTAYSFAANVHHLRRQKYGFGSSQSEKDYGCRGGMMGGSGMMKGYGPGMMGGYGPGMMGGFGR